MAAFNSSVFEEAQRHVLHCAMTFGIAPPAHHPNGWRELPTELASVPELLDRLFVCTSGGNGALNASEFATRMRTLAFQLRNMGEVAHV